MKKFLALLLAMTMVMALVACGGDPKPTEPTTPPADTQQPADADPAPADPEPAPAGASEITLWTYPIGDWGTEATVKTLTDAFTAETGIAGQHRHHRQEHPGPHHGGSRAPGGQLGRQRLPG